MKALRKRNVTTEIIDHITNNINEKINNWCVLELGQSRGIDFYIKNEHISARLDYIISDIKKTLNYKEKKMIRILDVGCYGGQAYNYIKNNFFFNFQYIGIDIQKEFIKECIEIHPNNNAFFQQGDIFDLSEYQGYDITICQKLLIHIPYTEKAIKNLLLTSPVIYITLFLGDESYCDVIKETDLDTQKSTIYYLRTIAYKEIDNILKQLNIHYKILFKNQLYKLIKIWK